jgi:hypothetical protein
MSRSGLLWAEDGDDVVSATPSEVIVIDWPAYVAPAKNNLICVFIVKSKRMRDAGRCAGRYPAAEHPHT